MTSSRAAPTVLVGLLVVAICSRVAGRPVVAATGIWVGPGDRRRRLGSSIEHVNDFAERPSVEWRQPTKIYQTTDKKNRVIEKAADNFAAKDQSVHWKEWKRATLNLYFLDAELDKWERNTTGAACSSSPHCETLCRESCLMDRIRQHCHREQCNSHCSIVPGSCNSHGRHCKYACSDTCMVGCIKKELFHFKKELMTCMPMKLGKCFRRCQRTRKANRPKDFIRCGKACVDSAQMACIGAHTRPCQEQCGRHSCLRGACVCPGLLSGDDECAAKPEHLWEGAPELSRHCFQSFFEPKFKDGGEGNALADISYTSPAFRSTQETWSIYHWFASANRKRKTETHPDLPAFSEWTSCALVGSSGSLTGSGLGSTIDERHTAWIRFNDAPTLGFEHDVGSRTTMRIQNNVYCGFNEGKQELCAPYTKFSTRQKCHPTEGRQCPLVQFSDVVHNGVHDFMKPEFYNHPAIDVNDDHWNTTGHVDTSAGFFGALMALHLCGEVTIYGFDQAPTHYYQKKASLTKKPFETRHGWGAEHYCFREYTQRFRDFRILEARDFEAYKTLSPGERDQPRFAKGAEDKREDTLPEVQHERDADGRADEAGERTDEDMLTALVSVGTREQMQVTENVEDKRQEALAEGGQEEDIHMRAHEDGQRRERIAAMFELEHQSLRRE